MKVSNLELNVGDTPNRHGKLTAPEQRNNQSRQQQAPSPGPPASVSNNNAAPFNYFALGGSDYNLGYVQERTKTVPAKIESGEAMLQRPPKVMDDVAALYSWPTGGKKASASAPPTASPGLRLRGDLSSSSSLPQLRTPDRATTAPGQPQPPPSRSLPTVARGPAEMGSARQLVNGYNLKGLGGTWQTVAKNEWDVDRPAMRADADGLAYGFTLAMSVLEGERRGGGSGHRGGAAAKDEALRASLENDLLAIKAQVSHSVDERQTLASVTECMTQLNGTRPAVLTTQALKAEVGVSLGVSPESLAELKGAMAQCVFEHKWTDLTFNQLGHHVSVSCRQQGDLLLVLRSRYANLCNKLSKMYADSLWQLDRAAGALIEARQELVMGREGWARQQQALMDEVERLKMDMAAQEAAQADKREMMQQESRDQVKKMGETLRTLNGIFRNMQTDVETMRAADLKDQIETLRAELGERKAELCELRPVVETVHYTQQKLDESLIELEATRTANTQLQEELRQREVLIQELMSQKGELLSDKDRLLLELGKAHGKAAIAAAAAKEAAEAEGAESGQGPQHAQRRTLLPSSVLCARCNGSLDNAIRVDEDEEYKGRLQCVAFRLLIPNNAGKIPERTVKWTRQCMRAVMFSKLLEVSAIGSTVQAPITRFPEYLYAWFEPSKSRLDGLLREERGALLDLANENRWGLYYGVKALARENAEARLFWSLLDETYGSDYQAFFLYSLNLIENIAGTSLRMQWGKSVVRGCDHDTLEGFVHEEDANTGPPLDPSTASTLQLRLVAARGLSGGQEAMWVELGHVKNATDILLSKAPRDVAVKVWESIKGMSVSSEDRVPPVPDRIGDEECVDLFLWLRLMMQHFRQDQINRRAAIKLMFTTSLSGVLTSELDYDPQRPRVRARDEDEKNPSLNLPQTLAIVRTLWPHMSTTESVALYRDIHDVSNGRVDFTMFMKVSERHQFFTRSLVLPPLVLAKVDRRLEHREHVELDALVHLHYTAMLPYYTKLKAMLPEQARARFEGAEQTLVRLLEGRRKTGFSDVDGLCPLFAYRRLLLLAHHYRAIHYEQDPDFTGLLTCVKFGGSRLLMGVRSELGLMERALLDDHEDQAFVLYQDLTRTMAACRIQASWRRRIKDLSLHGVPASVMAYMRRGYTMGRGGLKTRRQVINPTHVQSIVGEVLRAKVEMDRHMQQLGLPLLPFAKAVYVFFLRNYGCRSVAERALHDFFYNVRRLVGSMVRVKLFGLFVGVEDMGGDGEKLSHLQTDEAVDFYLRGVMLIRTYLDQQRASTVSLNGQPASPQAAQQTSQMLSSLLSTSTVSGSPSHALFNDDLDMRSTTPRPQTPTTAESTQPPETGAPDSQEGDSSLAGGQSVSSRCALFPVSFVDPKGRRVWEMPTNVLIAVSSALFKPVMGGNTSTADFLEFIEDVKSLETRRTVDVDEFMWIAMRFWSHIMSTRFTRARALIASSSNPIKHVTSAVNFRKLEDEVGAPYPEHVNASQQELLTLLAYMQSNDFMDRCLNKDSTDAVLQSLRKRLFIDMWEPVFSRCKLDLRKSRTYELNQLMHDWNSYELPLRAFVATITSRRSSHVGTNANSLSTSQNFNGTLSRSQRSSGVAPVGPNGVALSSTLQLTSLQSDGPLTPAQRKQSRIIEEAVEVAQRTGSLNAPSSLASTMNGQTTPGINMVAVIQLQNLLLELETELNRTTSLLAEQSSYPTPSNALGAGTAPLCVNDGDDAVLDGVLDRLNVTARALNHKDPWAILREALAIMNDILVATNENDIRIEFLQDVEPTVVTKLSLAPR